jgi:hypothetical protein
MKNIVCSIFGHNMHIKDFYPHDPITTCYCYRCGKIIEQYPNIMYGAVRKLFDEKSCIIKNQIISPLDPYGEEQWDD